MDPHGTPYESGPLTGQATNQLAIKTSRLTFQVAQFSSSQPESQLDLLKLTIRRSLLIPAGRSIILDYQANFNRNIYGY
jgi:hypothetical protein